MAWPDSWNATIRRSLAFMTRFFSSPAITRSIASSKSFMSTAILSRRAASSAASLTRLARSAPAKPAVRAAITFRSTASAIFTFLTWIRRMSSRPRTSGLSTSTWRSKRPGRSRAGSSTSGRLVARHDDDALARVEAVHLGEQLVEGLLALLVAAHRRLDADLAERVELVDEDDAGRLAFGLVEQVAHARRADADEHLDELGAAQAEERDRGLAGDRARQQRLAGSRRPDQQHALGDAAADARVLLRGSSGTRRSRAALLRPRRRPPRRRTAPSRRRRRRSWRGCGRTTSRRLRRRPCGGRRSSRARPGRSAGSPSRGPRSSSGSPPRRCT